MSFFVLLVGMKGASEQKNARRYSIGALSNTKPASNLSSANGNASMRTGDCLCLVLQTFCPKPELGV